MLSSACLWWMCFIASDICLRIVFCFAGLLPLFLFVVFVGCIGKSAKDVWVRILEMRVLLDFFNVACDGKDVKARLDCKQKLIEALTMVLTGRSGEY